LDQAGWEPGIHCAHLVIVSRLTEKIVGKMLRHLDQQGELIHASLSVPAAEAFELDERTGRGGEGSTPC
jgi:hypothetical protein